MPVARYWRVVGVKTYGGGDLSLSEVQLYGVGGRLDAGADLTSSHPPSSGTLANLTDNSVSTACTFLGSAVQSPGFFLMWDMGASTTSDIHGLRIASADSQATFLEVCDLQYLVGGVWQSSQLGRFAWPSARAFTPVPVVPAVFGFALGVTALPAAGSRNWGPSAIARTSRVLIAAVTVTGSIYKSVDGGSTWVALSGAGSLSWQGLAISDDGQRIVAAPYGATVRTSSDGGATWVDRTSLGSRNWLSAVISSDGLCMAVAGENSNIFVSTDGGANWTERKGAGVKAWRGLAMSANGQYLAAAPYNASSVLQVSSDGGVTWTGKPSAGSTTWRGVAISANGQKIIAAPQGGGTVYLSNDGGTTWAGINFPAWPSVAPALDMSDDGQVIWLVANYVPWYVSKDGGTSWVQRTATGSSNWGTVRTTSDGSIAISSGYGGTPYIVRERAGEFSEPALSLDIPASFFESASTSVPSHSTPLVPGVHTARDVEFGGPGTIYGATKTKGTPNLPTKARVVLLRQRSKLPVRETWSNPVTGYFEFRGIDTSQQFLALAEDAEGHFRPVAANRLTPEVP